MHLLARFHFVVYLRLNKQKTVEDVAGDFLSFDAKCSFELEGKKCVLMLVLLLT